MDPWITKRDCSSVSNLRIFAAATLFSGLGEYTEAEDRLLAVIGRVLLELRLDGYFYNCDWTGTPTIVSGS